MIANYTKGIVAIFGAVLAMLQSNEVMLPDFLTVGWIENLVLILTPLLVILLPNRAEKEINRINCHPLAVLSTLLLSMFVLAACVTPRPEINSGSDAIVVTSADIESAATTVHNLCGNTEPGGPCAPGALMDTDTKERLAAQLREARDWVKAGNRLLIAGDTANAGDRLDLAEAIILALQIEFRRREQ